MVHSQCSPFSSFVSVPCPSPGCTSMVPRRLLDEHLTQCEHRVKECPKGCGKYMFKRGKVVGKFYLNSCLFIVGRLVQ